jgi:hypothetical protein
MLAICIPAALIHFNDWTKSHSSAVLGIMYVSGVAAVACFVFWFFTKEGTLKSSASSQPAKEQKMEASTSASSGNINFAPVIQVGNVGTLPQSPPPIPASDLNADTPEGPSKQRNENDPIISTKCLRRNLLPQEPFDAITLGFYQATGMVVPPTAHDWLVKLHIVNSSNNPTTIQRIEASAEIGGKWVPLKASNLERYRLSITDEKKYKNTNFRNVFSTKETLPDLWSEIKGVQLNRGIGYEGWLAFELVIESGKLRQDPLPMKIWVVDALDGKHPVVEAEVMENEGDIVHYNPKALQP